MRVLCSCYYLLASWYIICIARRLRLYIDDLLLNERPAAHARSIIHGIRAHFNPLSINRIN